MLTLSTLVIPVTPFINETQAMFQLLRGYTHAMVIEITQMIL